MAEPIPLPPPTTPVTTRALVLTLPKISGLLFVEGCIIVVDAFVHGVFEFGGGLIASIPIIGGFVQKPLHAIEQKITHQLGAWESGLDSRYGTFFYALAQVVDDTASLHFEAALMDVVVAKKISGANSPAHIRKSVTHVAKQVHAGNVTAKAAATSAAHTWKAVNATHSGPVVRTARVVTRPIARAVSGVIEWDIPKLRSRTRVIERDLGRLERRVAHDSRRWGAIAFAGLVGAALARLRLGWLRCTKVRQAGKGVCGMNQGLLDALLAGTIVVAGSISVVELAKACQDITSTCEDGMRFFIREVK